MCWRMDFSKHIKLMCTRIYEQLPILGIALVHHNWTGLSSFALTAFEYAFPHRGRSKAPLTDYNEGTINMCV